MEFENILENIYPFIIFYSLLLSNTKKMNCQFNRLGQKIQGKVQQLGQKLTSKNVQNLGQKIQHNVSVGLRKAINTAGEISNIGQAALPYLYGILYHMLQV